MFDSNNVVVNSVNPNGSVFCKKCVFRTLCHYRLCASLNFWWEERDRMISNGRPPLEDILHTTQFVGMVVTSYHAESVMPRYLQLF
jgi:hypothetical protein